MSRPHLHPRLLAGRLHEALASAPVVLIHGPRQCGKTTLARMMGEEKAAAYVTFDDMTALTSARSDPAGFVTRLPGRVILDEIQKAPELFPSIKMAVDRARMPGRFLLTGSSNVLLVPRLSESLAGRMAILRLHPFSQAELQEHRPRFLDDLFGDGFGTGPVTDINIPLINRIVRGGFPEPLATPLPRRRAAWYRDYVETLIQRDARTFMRIGDMTALPRLIRLAAGQTSRLLNVSDLAAPFHVSRPTIGDYVTVLERLFLIDRLGPWHTNRLSRIIKTPKLHIGDTGLACALLNLDEKSLMSDPPMRGQMTETFVYQELRRQAGGMDEDVSFHHYRDRDGYEVDIVLEGEGGKIAGIEVKSGATVKPADFAGLRKLKAATGRHFANAAILYDGETALPFGDKLWALPTSMLWGEQ